MRERDAAIGPGPAARAVHLIAVGHVDAAKEDGARLVVHGRVLLVRSELDLARALRRAAPIREDHRLPATRARHRPVDLAPVPEMPVNHIRPAVGLRYGAASAGQLAPKRTRQLGESGWRLHRNRSRGPLEIDVWSR